MNRDEIDAELIKFLRDQKQREAREDFGVRKLIGDVSNQVQLVSQKLDSNYALTSERITGLSARIDKLEGDVEDTGVHNLQRVEGEANRWRAWVLGIAASLIVAFAVGSVAYIVGSRAPQTAAQGK